MTTREDITKMAREAGFVGFDGDNGSLRRFAALVAAAERKRIESAENHQKRKRRPMINPAHLRDGECD